MIAVSHLKAEALVRNIGIYITQLKGALKPLGVNFASPGIGGEPICIWIEIYFT